jgi:hypothetical protein
MRKASAIIGPECSAAVYLRGWAAALGLSELLDRALVEATRSSSERP